MKPEVLESGPNHDLMSQAFWKRFSTFTLVFTCEKSYNLICLNRPFSYSEKESQSNDTLLNFKEFSNVHNCDRSPNATRSNLVYKNVYIEITLDQALLLNS